MQQWEHSGLSRLTIARPTEFYPISVHPTGKKDLISSPIDDFTFFLEEKVYTNTGGCGIGARMKVDLPKLPEDVNLNKEAIVSLVGDIERHHTRRRFII